MYELYDVSNELGVFERTLLTLAGVKPGYFNCSSKYDTDKLKFAFYYDTYPLPESDRNKIKDFLRRTCGEEVQSSEKLILANGHIYIYYFMVSSVNVYAKVLPVVRNFLTQTKEPLSVVTQVEAKPQNSVSKDKVSKLRGFYDKPKNKPPIPFGSILRK